MNTKLILTSSGTIDLYTNIPVPLNFTIADIREIDKRSGAFSKTITIPGTKNNNKLLGNVFDLGISGTFNPNRKIPCYISSDDDVVFKGNMQLVKISKTLDKKIEYDVVVTGNLSGLFDAISDAKLCELDLSIYDHPYNRGSQSSSWEYNIYINGVTTASTAGVGYVYPMIDYGQDSTHTAWKVTNFYPAIYVKQYIDSIFSEAGYTYESAFFNTDFFKSLIIPFNSDVFKASEEMLATNYFEIARSATTIATLFVASRNKIYISYDSELFDPLGMVPTGGASATVSITGVYNFSSSLHIYLASTPGGTDPYSPSLAIQYVLEVTRGGVATEYSGGYVARTLQWQSDNSLVQSASCSNLNISLVSGDVLRWFVRAINTGGRGDNTEYFNLGIATSYASFYAANISQVQDTTVSLSECIDQQVTQRDFFSSIVKMFNLYIETDKNISTKLLIEPRNDFYSGGTTLDWTKKYDIDRGLEILPLGELDAKYYLFEYGSEKDAYNEKYFKAYEKTYSNRKITIDTDFLSSEKKTEVIFAPTPCVQFMNSNRVTPAIYTTDSNGIVKISTSTGKLRILQYGGLKSSYPWWRHVNAAGNVRYNNTYPYAGMVDDPTSPTISLDWGVPREIYWETTSYTNNNLYNKYWKQFMDEIFDNDGKIVSGYFELTAADIANLDFRNTIMLNGIAFRINKVIDYDPVNIGLTRVELIKAKNTKTFTPTVKTIRGGVKTRWTTD